MDIAVLGAARYPSPLKRYKEVLGFLWGYQGLDPEHGAEILVFTPELWWVFLLRGFLALFLGIMVSLRPF